MFNQKSLNIVKQLITSEKEEAVEKHGQLYNSEHEAYAVLLEEVQEAEYEIQKLKSGLNKLWLSIKGENDSISVDELLVDLDIRTSFLILESAQVSAVIKKWLDTRKAGQK